MAEDELTEFRFVDVTTATELLGPRLKERVAHCFPRIDEGITFYLENGGDPERITNQGTGDESAGANLPQYS
ncbi:MAG: hypothetical protein KDD70_19185 [Bdellovibrionales bacterium]|nr:hypothetical protein [Bdellovibrionales bacterium]